MKFEPALTVASPDLSQVAATLAGLFAELNDIPARRLGGDGHLSHSLFPVTEVHRQYHLKQEQKKKRVRRRLTQERKRGFKKMLLHENVFCRKYIWDVLKIRTSVIAWWCGLRTKLSSLERCMKPSVLTLHFAVHQRQLLVWAARGLMPVPATFLFTMIRACHSVEDISFRLWRWDIAMQVLTCFCQY